MKSGSWPGLDVDDHGSIFKDDHAVNFVKQALSLQDCESASAVLAQACGRK
jgi:hypothetical protein